MLPILLRRLVLPASIVLLAGCTASPDEGRGGLIADFGRFGSETGQAFASVLRSDIDQAGRTAVGLGGFLTDEFRRAPGTWHGNAAAFGADVRRDADATARNAADAPGFVAHEVAQGTANLASDVEYGVLVTRRDALRTVDNAAAVPGFVAHEFRQGIANLASDAEYAALLTRRDVERTADNLSWLAGYVAVESTQGMVRFVERDLAGAADHVVWDGRKGVDHLARDVRYLLIVTERDIRRTRTNAIRLFRRLQP